jgi:TPR repeat protein
MLVVSLIYLRCPPIVFEEPLAAAMNDLGSLYHNGQGVPQDYAKAREWYEKAAAKDFALAMYNLGVLYENGYGVAQDYAKAREWFEKGAAQGNAQFMQTQMSRFAEQAKSLGETYNKTATDATKPFRIMST